jgi:hypothetical protein
MDTRLTSRAPIPLSRLGHHNRERDFYDSSLGSTVKFRFRKGVEGPQLIVTGFIVDQLWSVGPAHAFANDHGWPETTPLSVRHEAIAECPIELESNGDVCSKVTIVPKR